MQIQIPLSSPSKLQVIQKRENGNSIEVRLPSQNGGVDTLEGLILPMSDSPYEKAQPGKFKEGWTRFVATQLIVLQRVARPPHQQTMLLKEMFYLACRKPLQQISTLRDLVMP